LFVLFYDAVHFGTLVAYQAGFSSIFTVESKCFADIFGDSAQKKWRSQCHIDYNNNNNNTLIYIAPACRMTSEALIMTL